MRRLPATLTVIFDGSCNFCTWSAQLVERLDRHRRVRLLPFQQRHVLAEHDVTQAEAEAAAWAISPSGRRYRGAGAINIAVAVATGSRLPILLYHFPLMRQLQDLAYEVIARNRHRFRGIVPYCEQHPDICV